MPHFLPVLLLIVPLLGAGACLLDAPPKLAEAASGVAAVTLASLGIWVVASAGPTPTRVEPGLYVDALSAVLVLVISAIGAVAVLYSLGYLRGEVTLGHLGSGQVRWYYLWLHLLIFSMLSVALAANLGILWVAMEVTTVFSG